MSSGDSNIYTKDNCEECPIDGRGCRKESAKGFDSKYNEDSIPTPEREIKKNNPGRPDLDYDQTPVGPAEGVEIYENNDTNN